MQFPWRQWQHPDSIKYFKGILQLFLFPLGLSPTALPRHRFHSWYYPPDQVPTTPLPSSSPPPYHFLPYGAFMPFLLCRRNAFSLPAIPQLKSYLSFQAQFSRFLSILKPPSSPESFLLRIFFCSLLH